jgi:hypothetical protein
VHTPLLGAEIVFADAAQHRLAVVDADFEHGVLFMSGTATVGGASGHRSTSARAVTRSRWLCRDASLLATAARGRVAPSSVSYQTSYTLWNTFARVNRCSAASRCSGPCLAWTTRMISVPVAGKSAGLRNSAMTGTVGVESDAGCVRASSFMGFLSLSSGRLAGADRIALAETVLSIHAIAVTRVVLAQVSGHVG